METTGGLQASECWIFSGLRRCLGGWVQALKGFYSFFGAFQVSEFPGLPQPPATASPPPPPPPTSSQLS